MAPLHLDAEHVRMTGHDGHHVSPIAYRGNRSLIDETEGVPQQVSGPGAQQLAPLADADTRYGAQLVEPGFELIDLDVMTFRRQLGERGPLLSAWRYVLALVGTYPACLWSPTAVLHGAGTADHRVQVHETDC